MTNHERECLNVQEALEGAREDWLVARESGDEIDTDRQMLAIDALLDTGLKMVMWAVAKSLKVENAL